MNRREPALTELARTASGGDAQALERLLRALADPIYRLCLRMTANRADAEDATQEVLIKVATRLAAFRGEARVSTWAHRIAVNHLLDRRKSAIEGLGLDFKGFAADLLDGLRPPPADCDPLLAEEVKIGCTLAMLTCLDRPHRLAYVLGEVFDLPAASAAEICGISEEAHRQRVSRAQRQLEAFTRSYCGLVSTEAPCRCDRRIARAIELGRLKREQSPGVEDDRRTRAAVRKMERLYDTAALFRSHPEYRAPEAIVRKLSDALSSGQLGIAD